MTYQWKGGARISADAQEVGLELEHIERKDAQAVVAAAAKSDGALHDCFEWNNTRASQAYRLEQARLLLRSIVVVEKPSADSEPIQYRAFEAVYVADDNEGEEGGRTAMVYIPTREALKKPELREQIMARLEQTIAEAERTAHQYEGIIDSFRRTKEKLREARETVRA